MPATDDAALKTRVLHDPVKFSRGILKSDLWDTQAELLQALTTHRRIAVKACHASGKSWVAARAVCWWLARYPDGVVITTAPTWNQVERVLWGEIRALVQTTLPIWPKGHQLLRSEFRLRDGNYAIGLSTDQGVRFQGFHGRILIVIDEAPGVLPDIWEAIEGIRAGGHVQLLALGNPVVPGGPFYDAFRGDGGEWYVKTIGAFDTPNLAGLTLDELLALPEHELDNNARPYLVTRRWVKEKYYEWGPDSPQWQSRVMAQFPEQDAASLMRLSSLEWAAGQSATDSNGMVFAGVDVAGEGSAETVLYLREGGSILKWWAWQNPDPKLEIANALEPYLKRLGAVGVDASGLGYHLVGRLREMGIPAVGLRGEVAASNAEIYFNKRAEMYYRLREMFDRNQIIGLSDPATYKQLALLRTRPPEQVKGKLAIETKDEMRRRGVASPDRADALCYAFAVQAPITVEQIREAGSLRTHRPTSMARTALKR